MSTFKVEQTEVREVYKHPNADRLDIVKVFDWAVVTQKDHYKVGDRVVYVPVDSLLTQELEDKIFPPDSKIKISKHRIKSIKIRQHISQGMVLDPEVYPLDYVAANVTKYELPAWDMPKNMQAKKKRAQNSNFKKYTDIENFKYYDRMFQDGEEVYISEKLHGSSFRVGWFLNEPNTIWKKILKLFGCLPKWEFCWGSRNVQIQNKLYHKGFYKEDIYTKMVRQYDLQNKIPLGFAVYGEIVGYGVQANYTYGCGPDEHRFYVYDVYQSNKEEGIKWLSFSEFVAFCRVYGLETVPRLYTGPFHKDVAEMLRNGDSTIGGQKIREGIVIKPVIESECSIGRKVLKFINDAYYLEEQTDFH